MIHHNRAWEMISEVNEFLVAVSAVEQTDVSLAAVLGFKSSKLLIKKLME